MCAAQTEKRLSRDLTESDNQLIKNKFYYEIAWH